MAQRTAGCIENNSDDLGNLVKQCHPSSLFCFNPFSQVALVVASELGVCSGFFVFLGIKDCHISKESCDLQDIEY